MKNIKSYKLFEAVNKNLNQEQIEFLDKYTKGTWKYNETSGLVDIEGIFDCQNKSERDFRGIKFGVVSGHFNCYNNNLISLEGAPQKVEGGFYCSGNNLTSLEGAPQEIGGAFYCDQNELTSLEGAPQEVGGEFHCDDFSCPKGEWTLEWVIENIGKYPILLTIIPSEILQKEINKNPAKMIPSEILQKEINKNPVKMIKVLDKHWIKLKKDPKYASLEFPGKYKRTIKVVSNLASVGL